MIYRDLASPYLYLRYSFLAGKKTGTTPPNAVHLRHDVGSGVVPLRFLGRASSGFFSVLFLLRVPVFCPFVAQASYVSPHEFASWRALVSTHASAWSRP